jgi:DNA-binding IclR family transcriptional regulator
VARPMSRRRDEQANITRPASANYHANALARGLSLLEYLAGQTHPLTLGEFAGATAMPKSTLVRLLNVLQEMEYVVRVDDRPSYRLGHKVQVLATAYVAALDVTKAAEPHLAPVSKSTAQTANLGVLDGDEVLHLYVSEPDRPLRFNASTGTRDYAYCTGLGKLLLAHVDPDLLPVHLPPEPYPAFTDNTITALDRLTRELRRIRRQGYALDDNERSVGLRCVAVPVEIDGDCVAAVSVSGPSGEFTASVQEDYFELLQEVAQAMSADHEVAMALRIVGRSLRTVPGR